MLLEKYLFKRVISVKMKPAFYHSSGSSYCNGYINNGFITCNPRDNSMVLDYKTNATVSPVHQYVDRGVRLMWCESTIFKNK